MDIQLINNTGKNHHNFNVTRVCDFDGILSLDMFDLNIIDLRDELIWRNESPEFKLSKVTLINEFKCLKNMIRQSNRTKFLYILPQNVKFKTKYLNTGKQSSKGSIYKYYISKPLKDMLNDLLILILPLIPSGIMELSYEKTLTKLGEETIEADFYFQTTDENLDTLDRLLHSERSEKLTAYSIDKSTLCTLNIQDDNQLSKVLKTFNLIEEKSERIPEWFNNIEFLDDKNHKNTIEEANNLISQYKTKITESTQKLESNNYYKSILYTSGEELEIVVRKILGEILEVNIQNFTDEKHEDFLIKTKDLIFIGEIKGVNHNIKLTNLSQLDHHYLEYVENTDVSEEKVFKLLIMNHQKRKPLNEREPVHVRQIKDAENKYDILIIETIELLKLYEMKLTNKISVQDCLNIFQETGLLTVNTKKFNG